MSSRLHNLHSVLMPSWRKERFHLFRSTEGVCRMQTCSHQSAAAPASSQNSSGDIAPMSYYAIPTIARITEQGDPCLLPYVVNVSSSGTHDSVTKP